MRSKEEETLTGKLVAFEGIDCAGKSSVIKLLPALLADCKAPLITCGERNSPLDFLLRGERLKTASGFIKTFLFATDRAWTYEEVCLPALRRGEIVLWDRYVDSAIIYRAVEFSLGKSDIDLSFVEAINKPFRPPDLTVYIDISVETSLIRAEEKKSDEPYNAKFLGKAREKYLERAAEKGYRIINGERPLDEVAADVVSVIRSQLKEFFP